MTATALPSASPSPTSTRAARIINAWLEWRAARLARPRLGTVIDGFALGTLLLAWVTTYVMVCPLEPVRHHAAQHIAKLLR